MSAAAEVVYISKPVAVRITDHPVYKQFVKDKIRVAEAHSGLLRAGYTQKAVNKALLDSMLIPAKQLLEEEPCKE